MSGSTPQTFHLLHDKNTYPLPADFNRRAYEDILTVMNDAVKDNGLDPSVRYVAVGSYGDCVILDQGEILLVSDAA